MALVMTLRKALEFYADEKSYRIHSVGGHATLSTDLIRQDHGDKARKALRSLNQMSDEEIFKEYQQPCPEFAEPFISGRADSLPFSAIPCDTVTIAAKTGGPE